MLHIYATFIVTFPFVIFLMLKPTVGIISSLNCPDCVKKRTYFFKIINIQITEILKCTGPKVLTTLE